MNTTGKIPATKQEVETAIEKAVDKIADVVGKGFAHHDTRFDTLESRLDGVESRLGKIEHLLMRSKSESWRAWKHGSNASKTPSPFSPGPLTKPGTMVFLPYATPSHHTTERGLAGENLSFSG
jgi:hypothetical protein